MKKFTRISLAAMLAASITAGCNSDYVPAENDSSNVAVYNFYLSEDDSVLVNLDTVFFSIDLANARIFNADSMPYGTPVTKLVPVIQFYEQLSKATLTVRRDNGTDTVFDYTGTDSVDFTHPVILSLVSASGTTTRDYTINVNVHKVKSDSLVWNINERMELPSVFDRPTSSRTSADGTTMYSLSYAGGNYGMAVQENAPAGKWETYRVTLPSGADVTTFNALDGKLYIVAADKLYCSSDAGLSWTDTGRNWSYIYGVYDNRIIGVTADNSSTECYPGEAATTAIPADMPVKGTSQALQFNFPIAGSTLLIFTGGQDASNQYSNSSWAYDGDSWEKLSKTPLPLSMRDMTMVPFYTFSTNSVFVVTEESVLMVFGGRNNAGMNTTVYISNDFGITWKEAGELMQLPSYFPVMYSAQAYVFNTTYTDATAPAGLTVFNNTPRISPAALMELPLSRATSPVESWECPYIYVYGGSTITGAYQKTIWRGTINRLKFKPII
ncbi:MAG: hypothetical protein K2L84_09720 [Muribaculaceae bacterium]|nr:hypothetical protein [Muribaculaceae bacterium]